MQTYLDLAWWLGHGLEVAGVLLVGAPVAADLFRSAPSRPLAGDLSGAGSRFRRRSVPRVPGRRPDAPPRGEGRVHRRPHTPVALLAVTVGEQLGLAPARLRELATGGLLHDIGKLSVPDDVLQKPGALDDEEYALVQRHAVWGDTLLGRLGFSPRVRLLVRGHHERLDGSGYPDGITSLSLETRVLAVCDVYDALRSERVYREAGRTSGRSGSSAQEAGTAFDARCVPRWSVFLFEPVLRKRSRSPSSALRPVDRVGILQSGDKRAALFSPRTGAPMIRYAIMSRLGLASPSVRLVRAIEKSNRSAASLAYATSAPPRLRLDGRPGERPV